MSGNARTKTRASGTPRAATKTRSPEHRIDSVDAIAYVIPTDQPEADGTLEWDSTTMVFAEVGSGDQKGIGYTYAHKGTALIIADPLRDVLLGGNALDIPASWTSMYRSLRNIGRPGMGLMAMAAVDHALWDLKGKLLDLSVVDLLGRCRPDVPVYGSGGFTSYSIKRLQQQLSGWVEQGIPRVKMKVGTNPAVDPSRVRAARKAIGDEARLMVDANGGYSRKQALALALDFAGQQVCWFEEPLPSRDLDGLRLMRDRAPADMDITAGEYGWGVDYFRGMLQAGAVDTLQIDSTRCGGFTGFLQCAAVAQGFNIPVSAHCAPHLHAHVCSAIPELEHVEYFHDHVRIESMFFDGLPTLHEGALWVDARQPGLGLTLKQQDVERYRVDA
ncbi:MAG: enolase C-terminal domain-like protein [Rhodanobacter sp.]